MAIGAVEDSELGEFRGQGRPAVAGEFPGLRRQGQMALMVEHQIVARGINERPSPPCPELGVPVGKMPNRGGEPAGPAFRTQVGVTHDARGVREPRQTSAAVLMMTCNAIRCLTARPGMRGRIRVMSAGGMATQTPRVADGERLPSRDQALDGRERLVMTVRAAGAEVGVRR